MVESPEQNRLKYFPITLFSTVMGLTGFSIALLRYQHIMHVKTYIGKPLLYAVSAWFVFLMIVYTVKLIKHPQEVKEEFNHPVKINFFPTISISMLLLSIGFEGISNPVSYVLWHTGAAVQLIFTFVIINIWFFGDFKLQTKNPAWFIPVVGNLIVPVTGLGQENYELAWFFFSVGFVLWIVLFTIMFYRIIFHEPLMTKFLPTLFILIAPPAVGFIAYSKLAAALDPFGRILFHFGLFMTILLLTMFRRFYKVPFFVSWWAYTFPLDAMTISSIMMYKLTSDHFFRSLSTFFLFLTFTVIVTVLYKTFIAVSNKQICVPE
jgi:tellurite resistance protein